MNYIIFDLEWNNAYHHAAHKFMNEIIEIGAVMLDERLEVVDTYKQMIYPRFTQKLSSRCKRLTKITNEEIKENGIDFIDAFRDFARWSRGDDNVFLSWSNSDLYVMTSNFIDYKGSSHIDFMHYYCDAQKYCMSFIEREGGANNQIGLSHCADIFGIEVDTEKLHRALTDCYVTAECFKKVFDKDKLQPYIKPCDKAFFERLLYKPYYITDKKSSVFNVFETELICPRCGAVIPAPKDFVVQNKSFKGAVRCKKCRKPYWVFIRAKKTYDEVQVKTGYVEMNKKRARKIN